MKLRNVGKNALIGFLAAVLLLSVSACNRRTANSNNGNTSPSSIEADDGATGSAPRSADNAVKVVAGEASHLGAGAAGEAVVKVTIQNGFHVNANPASAPALIATQLSIDTAGSVKTSPPIYPSPSATRTFRFSNTPLKVYEGTIQIKIPIKVDAKAQSGAITLHGVVKAQPCDEQVCYPPRNLEVAIPVVVD